MATRIVQRGLTKGKGYKESLSFISEPLLTDDKLRNYAVDILNVKEWHHVLSFLNIRNHYTV